MNTTDTAGTAENIEWLARVLAPMLDSTDIMTLDAPALDALDRLFREVTYDRREQVTTRKAQLWRASAITAPDPSALDQTELISSDLGWVSSVALIRRTDTGQHYIVSTNDEETLTWRSDAAGNPYMSTDLRTSGCRESVIEVAGGRGMTRAEAIRAIDTADAERLRPGTDWMWADDDDDDDDDESEGN